MSSSVPGEGSRGSSRHRPSHFPEPHPTCYALGWGRHLSRRFTVPWNATALGVNQVLSQWGRQATRQSWVPERAPQGSPEDGPQGPGCPNEGEVKCGGRRPAGAATGRGSRSPPAAGGQHKGTGAATAAAAGAAFPASSAARGASEKRGAGLPRPRPASAPPPLPHLLLPLPAGVKPERSTPRLTSQAPPPTPPLPQTGPPLSLGHLCPPKKPTTASLVGMRLSLDFRGLPPRPLAWTFGGSPPRSRRLDVATLRGRGGGERGIKGRRLCAPRSRRGASTLPAFAPATSIDCHLRGEQQGGG